MKKILSATLFMIIANFLLSQGEGSIWYFGSRAGLDFTSGTAQAITDGQVFTSEGSASIADRQGNLLFYTDGIRVWDKNHSVMPNGTGLLGNPSATQSAIIVPQPSNENIYYIFTVPDWGSPNIGFNYSIVDLRLNGGNGDVTQKNINLFGNCSEKVTATSHANGCDFWVMAREQSSNNHYSYRITDTGLNLTPIITSIGNATSQYYGAKLSPNGNFYVETYNTNLVEIYDFNKSTGVISMKESFTMPSLPYIGEFSPDESILYISTITARQIYQYDMTAANIESTAVVIGNSGSNIGTLQLAVDGKIYLARNGSNFLGYIENPNVLGVGCNYVDNGISLATGNSQYGLPSIITTFLRPQLIKRIAIENTCFEDQTRVYLNDTSNLLSVNWLVGDVLNPSSPIVNNSNWDGNTIQFTSPGTYYVLVDMEYSCYRDTLYDTFDITQINPLNLGNDTSLCFGDSLILDAGTGYDFYLWDDGKTTRYDTVRTTKESHCKVSNESYNLIFNGDFEQGNTGFTSQYNYNCGGIPQGSYCISNQGGNGWFSACPDKTTNTLAGNMMIVDAACGSNGVAGGVNLWCQTVQIKPNTDYVVSVWVANVSNGNNPAQIGFLYDGVQNGPTVSSADVACQWNQYYSIWNSGTSTSVELCINEQTFICSGADFAVDDISFAELCSKFDTIDVTIDPPKITPTISIENTCFEDQTEVTLNNDVDVASYIYGISHSSNPLLPEVISSNRNDVVQLSQTGEYYYIGEIDNGCYKDTIIDTFNINYVEPLDLGNDTIICFGEQIDFDLTASNYDSILWSDGSTNPTFSINSSGVFFCNVYQYGSDTCLSSDTIIVVVPADSVRINVNVSNLQCNGDNTGFITIIPTGSVGSGYQYQLDGAAFQGNSSVYTGLSANTYQITVQDSLGCMNDTVIEVTEPDVLSISNTPIKNLRCFGFTDGKIELTATGGTRPYTFDLNGNGPTTADSIFENLPAGVYTANVTDNNGCTDVSGLGIAEPSPLTLTTNVLDTCIFPHVDIVADASGGSLIVQDNYTYFWNDNPDNPTINVTPLSDTIITVYAQDDSLCYSDTITMNINLIPQLDFTVDLQDSCEAHSVLFTSLILNNVNPVLCSWDLGDGNGSDNCNSVSNTYQNPGLYDVSFSVTTDKGCTNTETKNNFIEVYPNPVAAFSYTPELTNILNPIYTFTNESSGADSYIWYIDELDTLTDQNVFYTFPDLPPGDSYNICLKAISAEGCTNDICEQVIIEDAFFFFIPNSFTPNGDGINELFQPLSNGFDIESYRFRIYDRWGVLMFETTSFDASWDGKYKGKGVPLDTYIWKIDGQTFIEGEIKLIEQIGEVTLVR